MILHITKTIWHRNSYCMTNCALALHCTRPQGGGGGGLQYNNLLVVGAYLFFLLDSLRCFTSHWEVFLGSCAILVYGD